MCDPIGWDADLPKGHTLPPGYMLEGIRGMDPGPSYYYWCQNPWTDSARFGPNKRDKRKACRQAWRDFRSGGTDPTAVD